MEVKIFSEYGLVDNLEDEVNDFLKDDLKIILDVKYTETWMDGDVQALAHSVLVLYKLKKGE